MMWLLLIIPVAVISVAIYFEKRGKRQAEEDQLTMKDQETLEENYISHGSGNESTKPENL